MSHWGWQSIKLSHIFCGWLEFGYVSAFSSTQILYQIRVLQLNTISHSIGNAVIQAHLFVTKSKITNNTDQDFNVSTNVSYYSTYFLRELLSSETNKTDDVI